MSHLWFERINIAFIVLLVVQVMIAFFLKLNPLGSFVPISLNLLFLYHGIKARNEIFETTDPKKLTSVINYLGLPSIYWPSKKRKANRQIELLFEKVATLAKISEALTEDDRVLLAQHIRIYQQYEYSEKLQESSSAIVEILANGEYSPQFIRTVERTKEFKLPKSLLEKIESMIAV